MIKILHTADIQVKCRKQGMFNYTKTVLKDIENVISERKPEIYVISGDLFEYSNPNESERKLIYEHIVNAVSNEYIKEVILIAGNHDLIKDNKSDGIETNNAISIFADLLKNITNIPALNKLRYFKYSGRYVSYVNKNIIYNVYSLEDNMDFKYDGPDSIDENSNEINICLYHDMVKEYISENKLPIRQERFNSLMSVGDFVFNSFVFAGDIHETWSYNKDNILFMYPGAPFYHTFGEGIYIDDKGKFSFGTNKNKCLLLHKFDNNSETTHEYENIVLPKRIQYFTFEFNKTRKNFIELKSILELNLEQIKENIGTSINYIKIKSNNVLLKYEKDIYDFINDIFGDEITKHIEFSYDKLTSENIVSTNPVIEEILNNKIKKIESNEFNLDDTNIVDFKPEDITLSKDDVIKLFSNSLKSLINSNKNKIVETDIIYNKVYELFESRFENIISNSNVNHNNIKFNYIITTGFMGIGPNQIKLDIDGITRIFGTNGIGKTTLFKMLRWVIDGTISENQKVNQVQKNNVLLFNKYQPNNDKVKVILTMEVNGANINVCRTLNRKWKSRATLENKLSNNSFDYIDKIEHTLSVKICNDNNDLNNFDAYFGDTAQQLLNNWFGSTINTIMFLNQTKIENILNMSPDKLNNLILEFIGVDYLNMLTDELPNVKDELMLVGKPKLDSETIFENLTEFKIKLKNLDKTINELEEKQKSIIINLEQNNSDEKKIVDELIKLGDIQLKVNELKECISNYEDKLSNLSIKELLVKSEFTLNDPKLNISENNILNNKINNLENECNLERENIDVYLTELIKNEKDKIADLKADIKEINYDIDRINNSCDEIFVSTISDIQKQNKDYDSKINEIKIDIIKLNNILKDNDDKLSGGYCSTCNRKYDDFSEEIENKLKKQNEQIKNKIDEFKIRLDKLNDDKINNVDILNETISISKNLTSTDELLIEGLIENYKKSKLYDNFTDKLSDKLVLVRKINNINDVLSEKQYIYDTLRVLYKHLFEYKKYSLIIDGDGKINIDIRNKVKKYCDKMESKYYTISKYKEKIEEYNKEYVDKLKLYNDALKEYQDICKNIDIENDKIRINNIQYEEFNNYIKNAKNELSKFEEKLPVYLKLIDEREIINNEQLKLNKLIDEINTDINDYGIEKLNVTNKINLYLDMQEQLKEYNRNNIVWLLYQKIIKNNFKDIIFDYYRIFLNNNISKLLDSNNFKLYWNEDNELQMVQINNGIYTYQNVNLSSGMETCFLGLSLIYCISILNVKNNISHIFIDEISGTLNKGTELSYDANNYQELLVEMLNKFTAKKIFIVDHNIDNLNETETYEVRPADDGSIYITI